MTSLFVTLTLLVLSCVIQHVGVYLEHNGDYNEIHEEKAGPPQPRPKAETPEGLEGGSPLSKEWNLIAQIPQGVDDVTVGPLPRL